MFGKLSLYAVLVAGLCLAQETTITPSTDVPVTDPTTAATTTSATTAASTTPASTTAATTPAATTTDATTTVAPTTPSPTPHDDFFRYADGNLTCTMFSGDFTVYVSYNDTTGHTQAVEVKLPVPSAAPVVNGTCGAEGNSTSWLSVNWGVVDKSAASFQLDFAATEKVWSLDGVLMNIEMSADVFPNSPDVGKVLAISGKLPGLSGVDVARNHSLLCAASIDSSSFNGSVSNSNETYTVTAKALGFKLEAFNSVEHTDILQQGIKCSADMMSDVVPIAVGCALAGLVAVVLVSYLIGRKRRSAAYQSVA